MGQQYWTVVVVSGDRTFVTDHFGSFSSEEAHREITVTLPERSSIVALVPGRHAKNSFAFSTTTDSRKRDWDRYVDPYDCSQGFYGQEILR